MCGDVSHSCSSVASCPYFFLSLVFWTMCFILMGVRVRLCLWGLASPVCHEVLEELRGDPSLRMPKAELQLWQRAVTVCPEMHVVGGKPNKTPLNSHLIR